MAVYHEPSDGWVLTDVHGYFVYLANEENR